MKYNIIIRPLFNKTGRSIDARAVLYEYWDDPNELVDRLRLLLASDAAGNIANTNEILSIIEELQEDGIIE
jgi:hypothetical protein